MFHGMSTSIEMLNHWFLCLVFDVISMAIEADVQGILCQTDILFWALPALYQIDHTLCLAGGRCVHLVRFFGDRASECICGLDVLTSFTASAVTWAVSIFPGSCGDGDRHFHLDTPFFYYCLFGGLRKGLTQNKDLVTILLV